MTDIAEQRLEAALVQRNKLRSEVERLHGRKDEVDATLKKLEEEIRSKGIEPEELDSIISKLETKLEKAVQDLESELIQARNALEPYLGEDQQ